MQMTLDKRRLWDERRKHVRVLMHGLALAMAVGIIWCFKEHHSGFWSVQNGLMIIAFLWILYLGELLIRGYLAGRNQ